MDRLYEVESEIDLTRKHLSVLYAERRKLRELSPDERNGRDWDIWVEGFAATGMSGTAFRLGPGFGRTFEDAVEWYKSTASKEDQGYLSKSSNGGWTYWGCKLFPDESSARRSFG